MASTVGAGAPDGPARLGSAPPALREHQRMEQAGPDWVAIYGAALATIIAVAQGVPWVLSRRPGIRVETLQSEYGVHDHAQVPHLKITAINGGPSPVQVIQWTLEDQPLWHMRAATSTWGNRLDRWGLPGPWRRSGLVAFFTSVPAESGLPRNVLPLVLPPNDHADWYMPIASERDFIANRANGNPDHLRARIHLADGRSAVSSWFELRDA